MKSTSQVLPEGILKMLPIKEPIMASTKIKAIGLRPISALVDITNYITYDLGRPLHVYDADKIEGNLKMRFAKKNETCLTLDEEKEALQI